MQERNDEISLRDLYLILRRSLTLIVAAALLAGVVAFVLSTILPQTYRSTTVVQVIPSPLGAQQVGGLDFNPRANLSYEAYRSIALDAAVLQQTLDILAERDLSLSDLKQRIDLSRISGPANPTQIASLTVEHTVRGEDPDRVMRTASAWSQASLDAVRTTITSSLTSMAETTAQALQLRQLAVDESEAAWQAFQARDNRDAIELQLVNVNARLAGNSARIDQLERQIAVSSAQQAFLGAQLEAAVPGTPTDVETQLATVVESGLISLEAVTQLRVLLATQPNLAQGLEQDLLLLLMRAEFQETTSRLVEHIAERDFILGELAALEAQAETLRSQRAELDRASTTLQRDLAASRQAFNSVADIAPVIDYASDLVSTSATLLSAPTIAPIVIGQGRVFNAVAAALLITVLVVLYIFLREAVRDREAEARPSPRTGTPAPSAPMRGESHPRENL